jgi:hypothetical protein
MNVRIVPLSWMKVAFVAHADRPGRAAEPGGDGGSGHLFELLGVSP